MSFSDAPCRTGQALHCWLLLIGQVYLNVTCRHGYTSCGCCFSLRLANVSLKNNLTSRHMFGAWKSVRPSPPPPVYSQRFWPGSQRLERWGWAPPASQTSSPNSPARTLQRKPDVHSSTRKRTDSGGMIRYIRNPD